MKWKIKQLKNIKLKESVMIEGLPGIGNVGKIAVDFMIDTINASKIYELTSERIPSCVFINENNQIEFPKIEIYHKKINNKDLLFISGDMHPIDEESSYEFCKTIFEIFKKIRGKEIITLGGLGLMVEPKNPRVFCTGTNQKIIKKYSVENISVNTYDIIGPIVGVPGLLLGLAKQKKVPSAALLAETYIHPTYLGIKGAREILNILNKKLNLKINIKEIDKEVKEIEKEIDKSEKINKVMRNYKRINKQTIDTADYIG